MEFSVVEVVSKVEDAGGLSSSFSNTVESDFDAVIDEGAVLEFHSGLNPLHISRSSRINMILLAKYSLVAARICFEA